MVMRKNVRSPQMKLRILCLLQERRAQLLLLNIYTLRQGCNGHGKNNSTYCVISRNNELTALQWHLYPVGSKVSSVQMAPFRQGSVAQLVNFMLHKTPK